ncbi:MAG: hypothetical protein Q4F29_00260 [Lachnospiraceae bacterium]|nr:hypothetical protein [Lachnospiraceae bacterium]
MAKSEKKRSANIGSASLILIFIVLCMGTFGLLSLSSAKKDLDLAKRNAEAVSAYYEADGTGEELKQAAGQAVQEAFRQRELTPEAYLQEHLGEAYRPEENCILAEIPMDYGQALLIQLGIEESQEAPDELTKWESQEAPDEPTKWESREAPDERPEPEDQEALDDGAPWISVLQWRVYNREEYEIDRDMPVWSGLPES